MAWFGFGRKKVEQPKPADDPAFKKGELAAQSIIADLDAFMARRFGHVKAAYLEVLNNGFDKDMDQEAHSPLLCARANLSVYIEKLEETVVSMKGEIMAAMAEWMDVMEQLAPGVVEQGVEQIADKRLGDWHLDMQTSGLKLMMDRAYEFKAIDDRWRRKHPEQAAEEPLD